MVDCEACGGLLKPDVVFFGENVPRPRVEECYRLVERSRALVVLGSSLTVRPAAELPRTAWEVGVPLVIVNREPTPLDHLASLVLHEEIGPLMKAATAKALA